MRGRSVPGTPVGRLRIIAGALRGRKIEVTGASAVRPTSDRVREALFSILGERVVGARVLDAFAGSGALGLEAASRGAVSVVLVESDRNVTAVLERNIERVGSPSGCRLLRADVLVALGGPELPGPFDLVLADPPYGTELGRRLLESLLGVGALASGSTVVVEGERNRPVAAGTDPRLRLERQATYGRTRLDLYRTGPFRAPLTLET